MVVGVGGRRKVERNSGCVRNDKSSSGMDGESSEVFTCRRGLYLFFSTDQVGGMRGSAEEEETGGATSVKDGQRMLG